MMFLNRYNLFDFMDKWMFQLKGDFSAFVVYMIRRQRHKKRRLRAYGKRG